MNILKLYTPQIFELVSEISDDYEPWNVVSQLEKILAQLCLRLGTEYTRQGTAYVHPAANVHPTAILQDAVIICAGASIGPHAMLRAGAYVGRGTHVGGSVEIKQSIIGEGSAIAHLNYVGNSIVGADVNLEAGAVLANHYNERPDKTISVLVDGHVVGTGVNKFGAIVGDHSRIGANAVTSPGTILAPNSIVNRLELVKQIG